MTQQNPGAQNSRDSMAKQSQDQSAKKLKRSSPFRIKVGCVVALRYRPEGNQVMIQSTIDGALVDLSAFCGNETIFTDVWSNPQPGRDEGLNLVGCRIRCCFPKAVMSKSFHEQKASSRMLEGEIISIVNNEVRFGDQRQSHRRREAHGTTVGTWFDEVSQLVDGV